MREYGKSKCISAALPSSFIVSQLLGNLKQYIVLDLVVEVAVSVFFIQYWLLGHQIALSNPLFFICKPQIYSVWILWPNKVIAAHNSRREAEVCFMNPEQDLKRAGSVFWRMIGLLGGLVHFWENKCVWENKTAQIKRSQCRPTDRQTEDCCKLFAKTFCAIPPL